MIQPKTSLRMDAAELLRIARDHCIFPMTSQESLERDGPNIYSHGSGVELTDIHGKTYLDMISSHTRANTLGYGNEEIARAVHDQRRTAQYVGTRNNVSEPTIRLAAKLAHLAPGDLSKTMFLSGGSEAVETALKLARHYQRQRGKPRAYKIISRWNAYHGATLGAMGATDWLDIRHISEPGAIGFSHIPGPSSYRNPFGMEPEAHAGLCADYLEQQILHEGPELVAAFIAEPVMQAHGVQIPPASYLPRVQEICRRYGVVFIVDEVITGFGRTGAWFAHDHFGIEPDIVTLAKALTAGYAPMGAVMARPEICDSLPIFMHLHTFGGHLGSVAAANAAIAICERDNLIARARESGTYLLGALENELSGHPAVGQVRGLGHWLAVEFTADKATKAPPPGGMVASIVKRMRELGVLAGACGMAFELAPPLITPRTALDRTVEVAARAIREVAHRHGLGSAP